MEEDLRLAMIARLATRAGPRASKRQTLDDLVQAGFGFVQM